MFEVNITELFIINVIRFAIGSLLLFTGLIGKESSLNDQPNTGSFVFLTGILLIGLSIG